MPLRFYLFVIALILFACTPKKSVDPLDPITLAKKPLPPEKAGEVLETVGGNVAYGTGMGDAALKIGTVVAFPPYALFLLSNAALSLSGYEPMSVTQLMSDSAAQDFDTVYDGVVGVPGRMTAAIAGREFRTRELGKAKIREIISENEIG